MESFSGVREHRVQPVTQKMLASEELEVIRLLDQLASEIESSATISSDCPFNQLEGKKFNCFQNLLMEVQQLAEFDGFDLARSVHVDKDTNVPQRGYFYCKGRRNTCA